jgi:Na+-transporting methylmalonyl-CoA/oxaloacetate decarboxylase gamma subunit
MKRLLPLIALLCLQASVASSRARPTRLLLRAERFLQTTGAQEANFKEHPEVKKFCEDEGIQRSDISISIERRNEEREKIKDRHKVFIGIGEDLANQQISDPGKAGQNAANGPLGVAFVFMILSFLSLLWIFIWSITECCCKKTCCVKENDGKDHTKAKQCCWLTGAVVAIVCIAVAIAWASILGKVVGRVTDVRCGVAIVNSDVMNGVKISSTASFAGVKGISDILTSFKTMLDSIDSLKADANTVKGENLDQEAGPLDTAYTTYKNAYTAASPSYFYQGTLDNSKTVKPVYLTALQGLIDPPLREEVNVIKDAATSIHNAAKTIADFDTSQVSSYKTQIDNFQRNVDTNLRDQVNKLYGYFGGTNDGQAATSSTDYTKTVKGISNAFIAVVSIFMVVMTVIYLVILFLNAKDKCYCCRCVNKIIMIIQILVGFLILLWAIFAVFFSIMFSFICYATDKALTDDKYFPSKLGKFVTDPLIFDLIGTCINNNGDGDLLRALNADVKTFDDISAITDGLQAFSNLKANLSAAGGAPYLGKLILDNLTKFDDGTDEDSGVPEDQDIVSGYKAFNGYGCAKDQVRVKQLDCSPSSAIKSQTTHVQGENLGSDYCIVFGGVPTHNYATRYSSTTCASGSNQQTVLTNLAAAMNKYKSSSAGAKSDFSTFYTKETGVFNKLSGSVIELDRILTGIQSSIDALQGFNGKFKQVVNCKILNKEIILVENVFCYRIGNQFYHQSNLAVAFGVILFFYGWCMCCGIRLIKKKEESLGIPYRDATKRKEQIPQGY